MSFSVKPIHMLALFMVATVLYGVSWNMYRQKAIANSNSQADPIYFVALGIQVVALLGLVIAHHKQH